MGKHSKKNTKKEKKRYQEKVWETSDKQRDQLCDKLYSLPHHIEILIYHMALASHMIKWRKEHRKKMSNWKGDSSNWHKEPLTLDLIQGWGIQAPEPNYFDKSRIPNYYSNEFRGKIPDKYKIKLCGRNKVINIKDGKRRLDPCKIDVYGIPHSKQFSCFMLMNDHKINRRKVVLSELEKRYYSDKYWVANKCRCITCDLIRLTYHNHCCVNHEKYEEKKKKKVWGDTYSNLRYVRLSYEDTYNWGMSTISGYWFTEEELSEKQKKQLKKYEKLNQ